MEYISEGLLRYPVRSVDLRQSLSASIAFKRDFSTVFLTVGPGWPDEKPCYFSHLQVPKTIEWE
jgi:hypothetical protein